MNNIDAKNFVKIVWKIEEEGFNQQPDSFHIFYYKRNHGSIFNGKVTADSITIVPSSIQSKTTIIIKRSFSKLKKDGNITFSSKEYEISFDEFFYLYVQKNMTFSKVLERKEKETK